jgi:hypothetical protein
MKISKAIKKLQKILDKRGDLDLLVDTEAGKFPCHYVDVEGIWETPKEILGEDHCYITLDGEVMARVHPWKK